MVILASRMSLSMGEDMLIIGTKMKRSWNTSTKVESIMNAGYLPTICKNKVNSYCLVNKYVLIKGAVYLA